MSKGRLLAVLALLLGCALLWRGFFEPGRQRGMPQDTPPVRVATALAQDMPHFLNGLGTVVLTTNGETYSFNTSQQLTLEDAGA